MTRRIICAVLALLLAACALPALAELAAGDTVRVEHCNEYITLRETPSTKAAELDRLPLHAEATFVAAAADGFALVEYNGRNGYVLAKYLEPAAAEGVGRTGDILVVSHCNEYITLREDPSTKAAELDRMPLGARVNLIGRAENGFAYVEYGGQAGYALEKYLEVAESYAGAPVSLSGDARYSINLYLSNFSEQSFAWGTWCYDASAPRDADLIVFGINHVWFNQHSHIEGGEWGEDNTRLAEGYVAAAAQKYLRRAPTDMSASYFTYRDGYFYWQETGGHVPDGFTCLDAVEALGEGRYAVRFHVYGGGNSWDNECCRLTPAEAAARYSWVEATGFALIDVGEGSLEDRTGWSLQRWVLSR